MAAVCCIHNLFGYGHFPVHAAIMADYALSRGFDVAYLAPKTALAHLGAKYRDQPRFSHIDPGELLELPLSGETPPFLETVRLAQKRLRPELTILLSGDKILFHDDLMDGQEDLFDFPTHIMTTFGFRDFYLGFTEVYARRLRRVLLSRKPFAGVFTLDEYHLAAHPEHDGILTFCPDPYREFSPAPPASNPAWDRERDALAGFLDKAQGEIIPILGKFDERKNNHWIIDLVVNDPGLSLVILGQRIPSARDTEIDANLTKLAAQGRVHARFAYLPEDLFAMVLSSPRVTCMPLPYTAHYGSSGVHLHALEHGVSCLVPDNGLMARRTMEHGLGRIHKHGDFADFSRQFMALRRDGRQAFAARIAAFMAHFREHAFTAALDAGFGLSPKPNPMHPLTASTAGHAADTAPGHYPLALDGLSRLYAGEPEVALTRFQSALALAPEHEGLLFRSLLAARAAGQKDVCRRAMKRIWAAGKPPKETEFSSRLLGELGLYLYLRGEKEEAWAALDLPEPWDGPLAGHGLPGTWAVVLAELLYIRAWMLQGEGAFDKSLATVEKAILLNPGRAEYYQLKGGHLARNMDIMGALDCFHLGLSCDPDFFPLFLNISDSLRYLEKYPQSLVILDELVAKAPKFPQVNYKRGLVLALTGDTGAALAAIEAELAAHPGDPASLDLRSRLLAGQGPPPPPPFVIAARDKYRKSAQGAPQ